MGHIFISYSRRNTEAINKIVDTFGSAGLGVWIDREDIKAGNSWRVQIVEAIDTCNAFVLMLSGDSAASANVHKEVILAAESGCTIFVLMLEPVKPPAEIRYQLAGLQFIDVHMLGVDKAVSQLLAALQEHLKKIKPAGEQAHNQAELVIQGINLSAFTADKQEQLLAFISDLANTDRSQLKIQNMTAGSVHVFIRMPAVTAFELKTRALNRDKRFKKLGIISLRLAGDKKFVNIALGVFTLGATIGPINVFWLRIPSFLSSIFGVAIGKLLTLFAFFVVITGLGIFAPSPTRILNLFFPIDTPTFTMTPSLTSTPTFTLTSTSTPTPTFTSTATNTSTPSMTASPTPTPVPVYKILTGVVMTESLSCRYGPGEVYLYQYGLKLGIEMQVLGRDVTGGWIYGIGRGYESPCWVNVNFIKLDGDVSSLEPLYPGKIKLPPSRWPVPQNVEASRKGDQVIIAWTEFLLPLGERESANSPLYLAELWLCNGGRVTFTPMGVWEPYLVVTDEAGCSEPSHGVIYLAEKHGYAGPVEIPWPQAR